MELVIVENVENFGVEVFAKLQKKGAHIFFQGREIFSLSLGSIMKRDYRFTIEFPPNSKIHVEKRNIYSKHYSLLSDDTCIDIEYCILAKSTHFHVYKRNNGSHLVNVYNKEECETFCLSNNYGGRAYGGVIHAW